MMVYCWRIVIVEKVSDGRGTKDEGERAEV